LDGVKVGLEVEGSCCGVTVRSEDGSVISKGCRGGQRGGWEVSGVEEVEERPENTALGNSYMT
jgi:hypothetical protein